MAKRISPHAGFRARNGTVKAGVRLDIPLEAEDDSSDEQVIALPVFKEEIEVLETYFSSLLDEILGTARSAK